MLTRDDLNQIRGIVREEVHDEVQNEVRGIIREEVRKIVKVEVSLQLKPVNRKLNRLQKDITFIVHDYSNAIMHVRKRVERIEEHLDLPQ